MLLIKILFYIFAHKNIFSITRANPRSYHTFQSRKESCVPNTVKYIEAPTQFKRCSHTCWESLEWYVCNHRRFYNIYNVVVLEIFGIEFATINTHYTLRIPLK